MTITYFGQSSNPTSDPGEKLANSVTTLTPPASMAAGDLVVVFSLVRTSATPGIGTTGGQTWTNHGSVSQSSTLRMNVSSCVFNGTWTAEPTVDMGTSSAFACGAWMTVWRPSGGSTWSVDTALSGLGGSPPSSPFTMTQDGATPSAASTLALAFFGTADDNTLNSLTSGWAHPGGTSQLRSGSAVAVALGTAYKIQSSAAATGNVSLNQATLGGDAFVKALIIFAETPGSAPAFTGEQTVANFANSATAAAIGSLAGSQTASAFTQTATAEIVRTVFATQTAATFTQSATAEAIIAAEAAQTGAVFTQTATGAAIANAVASQTVSAFAQSFAATGTPMRDMVSTQTVASFSQSASMYGGANPVNKMRTEGEQITDENGSPITDEQTGHPIWDEDGGQHIDSFTQVATAAIIPPPASMSASQTIDAFTQTATATVGRHASATQQVVAFGQTATAGTLAAATASHTIDGFTTVFTLLDNSETYQLAATQQVARFDTLAIAQATAKLQAAQTIATFQTTATAIRLDQRSAAANQAVGAFLQSFTANQLVHAPISLRLSGGAANANSNLSLGGARSSVVAPRRLFGSLDRSLFLSGRSVVRVLYVVADESAENLRVYVPADTASENTTIDLAWGPPAGQPFPVLSSETDDPADVTFSSPRNADAAPSGGTLAAGEWRSLLVRLNMTAGVPTPDRFRLSAQSNPAGGSGSSPSGFVYREGRKLMLDGVEWKFVGMNDFSLTGCHTGSAHTASAMNAFFAALRPRTLTRTWAFEHQQGSQAYKDGLDRLIASAELYDQKVMLVLQEGAGHCGVPERNRAWYQSGYQGGLYTWIDYICARYKNSPAVVWEICNEMGQGAGGDMTQAECKAYLHNCAARIKAADPNHLVSSGCIGSWKPYHSGQAGYQDVHNSPYIDLVTSHEYEYDYNGNTGRQGRHPAELAAAVALNKAIFIGEFGCARSSGTSPSERATVCTQKFDAYLDATNGQCAGALMWTATSPPNNGDGTVFSMAANEPYGGPVLTAIKNYTNPALVPAPTPAPAPAPSPPPSTTNYNTLTKTQRLDDAVWSKELVTVTANAIADPLGGSSADKIVESAATGEHAIYQFGPASANGPFSAGLYVKAAERGFCTVYMSDFATGGAGATINLATGAITTYGSQGSWTGVSNTIANPGNGWWRINCKGTRGAGTQTVLMLFVHPTATYDVNYAGSAGSGIYAFGANLEPGTVDHGYQEVN